MRVTLNFLGFICLLFSSHKEWPWNSVNSFIDNSNCIGTLDHCSKFAACGQTLQDSAGKFSSITADPNAVEHPEQWCQWRIAATHGEKIVLNITDLDIRYSPNCETDYLEIHDGHWLKSPLLGMATWYHHLHSFVLYHFLLTHLCYFVFKFAIWATFFLKMHKLILFMSAMSEYSIQTTILPPVMV